MSENKWKVDDRVIHKGKRGTVTELSQAVLSARAPDIYFLPDGGSIGYWLKADEVIAERLDIQ